MIRFCEERLSNKYIWVQRHQMRVYHDDPVIMNEYEIASKFINDKGMLKFKQSVDRLKKVGMHDSEGDD